MKKSSEPPDRTVPLSLTSRGLVASVGVGAPTLALQLYHRHGAEVVALEEGAPVVVGRAAPADVVIDDHSLSRQHARFTLAEGALTVEDLGSTNGTRVRGERVEHAALRVGEPVALGSVIVLVHLRSPLEPALRALDGHDSFCRALEREIARCKFFTEPCSIMMLRALRGEAGSDAHVAGWCQRIRAALRPVDTIAVYSDEAVEVLLPRTAPDEAEARASTWLTIKGKRPITLVAGTASFPQAATSTERLLEACRRAAHRASAEQRVCRAPAEGTGALEPGDPDLVAVNPAMTELLATIEKVAKHDIPVLIQGETGTGKEVVARAIHQRSPRRDKPLLCVNCGALPPQLVESTLFGHVRGAFTGADTDSQGVFGAADGGTLLLDEIGELQPGAQVTLLRVLESRRLHRVGSPDEVQVDVRVLAATNCDLEQMCADGSFRRDLLYRLNAVSLRVPPLRDRLDEIPTLVRRFLQAAMQTYGCSFESIAPEALAALQAYGWPGNLRELRNAIERAVVIASGERIELDDLPLHIARAARPKLPRAADRDNAGDDQAQQSDADLKTRVRRYEARLIVAALREAGGNQTNAAQRLRVPLRTLVHKIKNLGIAKTDYQ